MDTLEVAQSVTAGDTPVMEKGTTSLPQAIDLEAYGRPMAGAQLAFAVDHKMETKVVVIECPTNVFVPVATTKSASPSSIPKNEVHIAMASNAEDDIGDSVGQPPNISFPWKRIKKSTRNCFARIRKTIRKTMRDLVVLIFIIFI